MRGAILFPPLILATTFAVPSGSVFPSRCSRRMRSKVLRISVEAALRYLKSGSRRLLNTVVVLALPSQESTNDLDECAIVHIRKTVGPLYNPRARDRQIKTLSAWCTNRVHRTRAMNSTSTLARTADRLDELHSQINALNDALQEMVDAQAAITLPRRHSNTRVARAEPLRFRRQALKLAIYAPY